MKGIGSGNSKDNVPIFGTERLVTRDPRTRYPSRLRLHRRLEWRKRGQMRLLNDDGSFERNNEARLHRRGE